MEQSLVNAGFEKAKGELSDIFIINSCAVTEEAEKKALSALKSAKGKGSVTVLTGCFSQLKGKELKNSPFIDFCFGNTEKYKIAEYLLKDIRFNVDDIFGQKDFVFAKISQTGKTRATLKIQDGCNNRCSYCTICLARGKSRSAKIEDIIEQVNEFVKSGYNEVVLTGIHIGQWGFDLEPKKTLPELLRKISETEIKTIRLGSLDPIELSADFINSLPEKICPHFHISLQSPVDEILKQMNRHYDFERIKQVVDNLNEKFDNPFIGCDVITGFPGETDKIFEKSVKLLESLNLSRIHVFPYSKRPGTAAAVMENQIPEFEKSERVKIITEISNKKLHSFLQKNLGRTFTLTAESKRDKKTGMYKGITPNYIKVLFSSDKKISNRFVKVKITEIPTNSDFVFGEITN